MYKTQCEMILDHLSAKGTITQRQALREYGVARLASRVYDLKRHGHKIARDFIPVKNRRGEEVKIACYRLEV